MFKWLFILPVIALIDPLLLYWLWPRTQVWQQVAGLVVYPLAATVYSRRELADASNFPARITRLTARIMAWYLGPISKLLSFILLLPPVERAISRWAVSHIQSHMTRGLNFPNPHASTANDQGGPPSEKLRRTRGRVIE
jgi:hypothetical protein